jgi:transcription antitermination factor NusA-like protein
VKQVTNVLQIHEIEVIKENIDLKIKIAKFFYEVQFLTIAIVETTLFVFGYE